jgi:hypothetical protein
MLLHFLDLAPTQIYNYAYSLVGVYSEKTGYKHKLFYTKQKTDNNGLVFKCCILHKIIVRYVKKLCKL